MQNKGGIAWVVMLMLSILNQAVAGDTTKKLDKPNVLFIAIDDLRPELGCYGKKHMRTPHIDKLAASSAVFTHHYVQVPTCGASRFSMLTGLLPTRRDQLSNHAIEKYISENTSGAEPETFIHHLKNNGYYTVGMGKISHSADGRVYGYTDPVSDKKELPNSWNELLFDAGKWQTGWNAFFAYANGENRQSLNRQVKPYEKADVSDAGYPDGLTAGLAIEKLKQLAKKDQPFFMGVGFFKPHLPFNAPQQYWDMYTPDQLPLAPFAAIPKGAHKASFHPSGELNGYQLGEEKASLKGPVSIAYAKKLRHAYFASISYVDAQVGKLIRELEAQGLAENTVVVIWGDHGWHLGDHLVWGKHTLYERALNSTLLIKVPKITQGKSLHSIVSSIDLYPTLMELCGVEMPHATDGKSLISLMKGNKKSWKNVSYSYYKNGITLRTARYRFTRYITQDGFREELYDHKSDPFETKNIASTSPELVQELISVWEKGDTGLYHQ
jgi:arylsulfatase A-like enzyme